MNSLSKITINKISLKKSFYLEFTDIKSHTYLCFYRPIRKVCYSHLGHHSIMEYIRSVITGTELKGALSGLRRFLAFESSFKNDEKCSLFHLKSLFRSQDIQIFVLTFCSCRKTA